MENNVQERESGIVASMQNHYLGFINWTAEKMKEDLKKDFRKHEKFFIDFFNEYENNNNHGERVLYNIMNPMDLSEATLNGLEAKDISEMYHEHIAKGYTPYFNYSVTHKEDTHLIMSYKEVLDLIRNNVEKMVAWAMLNLTYGYESVDVFYGLYMCKVKDFIKDQVFNGNKASEE